VLSFLESPSSQASTSRAVRSWWERFGVGAPPAGMNTYDSRFGGQLSLGLASLLALDGLAHVIWATGVTWPFADRHALSLAVLGMAVPFTAAVVLPLAALLWTASACVLARGHLGRRHRFGPVFQTVTALVTVGLLARGLFGVVWAIASDGMLSAPFWWLNAFVYTPVCLVAGGAGWLLLGRSGRSPARAVALLLPLLLVAGAFGAAYGVTPAVQSGYQPSTALDGAPSRHVDTALARFHYLREGTGTPVVLLSPGSAWVAAWAPELHALSATHTVYVVDLPGQGFTTLNNRDFVFDLDGMTTAIETFLDAVHVKSAALAGNSWSGGWALAYAQRHPSRVSSLVLLDPSGLDQADPVSWEMLKLPVVGRALTRVSVASRSMTESGARGLFVHQDRVTPALIDGFWAAATQPDNIRATYELEAKLDWSVTQRALPRTTQPTLLIWGRQDTVLPVSQATVFAARMPHVAAHVLDGCGHAITLDCPGRVSALMTGFLRAR